MKYVDEYRDQAAAAALVKAIHETITRPWTLMEICGGQTNSIVRYGIDQLLPSLITLVHGPGCPVCVTPLAMIDHAHAIAMDPRVIFCSFGDMLRVPGSRTDLQRLRARGHDIRIVYSPLEALAIAAQNPRKLVVFFAIGFETTAPANATAIAQAKKRGLDNFQVLVSHVLVPPAITAILASPDNQVQAFLGPGHVCTVVSYREYEPIAARYQVPIVISGFEPVDLLEGILLAIRQLEAGSAAVENQYARAVTSEGNLLAQHLVDSVFERCDREWRGIGLIPDSGLRLRPAYAEFAAERTFNLEPFSAAEAGPCISGQILTGRKKPIECPAFGTACSPATPLGATMVSAEGACAAYYNHGRCRKSPPLASRPNGSLNESTPHAEL